MKYLIVQDWDNTHGNHAGMVHMCTLLCEKFPEKYYMVVKPETKLCQSTSKTLISRLMGYIKRKQLYKNIGRDYISLCKPIFAKLEDGDEFFLLEYHLPIANQYELAKYLRSNFPFVKLYGLSHLTPFSFKKMSRQISSKSLKNWSELLDKQLTLGSSLSNYLVSIGVPKDKISTGFHYVDDIYYKNNGSSLNRDITIISMGAQMRNYSILSQVVKACRNVKWIICAGRKRVDELFGELDNVSVIGYVEEDGLRNYMSKADISINIMEDTVGSNVITTSMAMGLAMVVSDVGSIHDYCNSSNALFCNNEVDSFVTAINQLVRNPEMILSMKLSSLENSKRFSISNVDKWFDSL